MVIIRGRIYISVVLIKSTFEVALYLSWLTLRVLAAVLMLVEVLTYIDDSSLVIDALRIPHNTEVAPMVFPGHTVNSEGAVLVDYTLNKSVVLQPDHLV